MNATILLVEDNKKLNDINRRALEFRGYTVITALTLAEARACLEACRPDVILLDVMLPDGDGMDFCSEIRERTDAHILFLTSRTQPDDRIRGLLTGGDDYITKPYKLAEMLARVSAALRRRGMRAETPSLQSLTCGPLALDAVSNQALYDGRDMTLTQKQFALLFLLAQHEGRYVSKETLYQSAWGQPMAGNAGALWKNISLLKKCLEEHSGGMVSIFTSRGEGYSLMIE